MARRQLFLLVLYTSRYRFYLYDCLLFDSPEKSFTFKNVRSCLLSCVCKVDRLLTDLTAQQSSLTAQWDSNKQLLLTYASDWWTISFDKPIYLKTCFIPVHFSSINCRKDTYIDVWAIDKDSYVW